MQALALASHGGRLFGGYYHCTFLMHKAALEREDRLLNIIVVTGCQ